MTISDLETRYNLATDVDSKIYDEMKSNVLLYSGFHYMNKKSSFNRATRTSKLSVENKVRLTKNHLNRAIKRYINNILSFSPGVTIVPKNNLEMQDQADADLSLAVWQDIKYDYNFDAKVKRFAQDFVIIGEVWFKQTWDPNSGDVLGYNPVLDELGQPLINPLTGEVFLDQESPILSGKFIYDMYHGYDVFRDSNVKTFEESEFIGLRKMANREALIKSVEADESKGKQEKSTIISALRQDGETTYTVFNGATTDVGSGKNQLLLKEYFFKPSDRYPEGYFFITCSSAIIWEGVLQKDIDERPIFPISYAKFDEFQGTPRGFSPIKQARPVQAEINRSASKIAETQMTYGDDKLITYYGGGITEGQKLNGIREIKVKAGQKPEILAGRSGEQYLGYMQNQITELYTILDIAEDTAENPIAGQDITATLYKSMKEKKKYVLYAKEFERFLVDIAQKSLKLAKAHYPDQKTVKAVGDYKAVNIAEFKRVGDMSYDIKVVPMGDDIESMMGKYLILRDTLQYASGQLGPENIGTVLKNMPFANSEEIFSGLTQKSDSIRDLLLALDRGEQPIVSKFADNDDILDAIVKRINRPDYKVKVQRNPEIAERYMEQYEERTAILNEEREALRKAQAGAVPTGGTIAKCDVYVNSPDKPGKTVRLELPTESIEWLQERLAEQGAFLKKTEELPLQTQTDIASGNGNVRSINGQARPLGG